MVQYMCFRCNYKTKYIGSMRKHFNNKKRCERCTDSLKYSDDEILKLSFMDYNDSVKISFDKNIKNMNRIKKSKNEMIDEIKNIFKEKRKSCNYCNTHFDTIKDLRNHILTQCIEIEIINSENEKNKKDDNILNTNNIYNTNQSYNSNSNNNNNITINIISNNLSHKVMSFDKEWDTSHLSHETKLQLFLSTMKFTKTLEYILKNDANLNVLLDKENEYGYIYKDTDEKIHKMKRSDIIDESFGKLYNHLKDFSNEILINDNFSINKKVIISENEITDEKFNNFNNNNEIKKSVENLVSNIFVSQTEKIKDNFKNIIVEIEKGY